MSDKPALNVIATPHEIAAWPNGSDSFVESFAKGLAVIGAFGDAHDALTLAEIAVRTGLSRAGVRRLVLTLLALNLASQKDGRFSLTPRVMRLGYAYLSSLGLREAAQPVIDALAHQVDETVGVSVLDGHEITYIVRAEVRGLLRRSLTIGSRSPTYPTSMGRVLLAGLSDASIQEILRRTDLVAFTRYTKVGAASLLDEIRKVRKQGFSLVSQELELGVFGIAAPIRDANGCVIAALNLSTNLARYDEKSFLRKFKTPMLEAATTISKHLPPQ